MAHIYIHPDKVRQALDHMSNGKFFSVLFVKADGSLRTMQCRSGVHKDLAGGKKCCDESRNVQVWENNVGYRTIPVERVLAIRQADKEVAA